MNVHSGDRYWPKRSKVRNCSISFNHAVVRLLIKDSRVSCSNAIDNPHQYVVQSEVFWFLVEANLVTVEVRLIRLMEAFCITQSLSCNELVAVFSRPLTTVSASRDGLLQCIAVVECDDQINLIRLSSVETNIILLVIVKSALLKILGVRRKQKAEDSQWKSDYKSFH